MKINDLDMAKLIKHKRFTKWANHARLMLYQIGVLSTLNKDSDVEILKQAYYISIGVSRLELTFLGYVEWMIEMDPRVQGVFFSLN